MSTTGPDPAVGEQRDDLVDERGGGGGLLGDRSRAQDRAVHLGPLLHEPRSGTAGIPPASVPTITMRPPGAIAATSAVTYAPPTRSITTSGAPPCSAISCGEGQRLELAWREDAVVQAELRGASSSFDSVRAVPVTVQPNAFASCTTAVPTPEPTAWTSTCSPGCEPTAGAHRVVRGDEHLGDAARGRRDRGRSGTGRAVRRGDDHVLGLRAAADDAEHPVAGGRR